MFYYEHPYKPILFEDTKRVIVGTLPPPRFFLKNLKEEDVDFPYGSKDNLLWKILDKLFFLNLNYKNSTTEIDKRLNFLKTNKIGICDIVQSCKKEVLDSSDNSMKDVILRDIFYYLKEYKNIDTILFTGKNSKNSPEYFFRQIIKKKNIKYEKLENDFLRVHKFVFENRTIFTISLISPSNAANRSIGSNHLYKKEREKSINFTNFDFRLNEYKKALEFENLKF
ncbi:uracil-DNA glycosylase family protein [Aliarcobacter trophiarum]|uniref:Mug-like uracil-DNA glycosylase n=1 Tax=Aliarcobacter trophiarum LMG 25534 TaxID=1032241 RepID=A0AAD0QI03_9BACT|nr:uracil-DNA glycosylase family protein [Aliarcobacter trophiarum]AXK48222.1 Mug-like uracil-DNA glycosylase [Aliarcobacter trophiarum LMG 25534]